MNHINKHMSFRSIVLGLFLISISHFAISSKYHVLDHNADHVFDLLAINSSNQLIYQAGNGDGTFANPSVISLDFTPVSVELGDINGDNIKDLIALDSDGDVSWSLNDGLAGFDDESILDLGLVLGEVVVDLKLGHYNNDDLLDVFVVVNGLLNARVSVFENDPNGDFLARVDIDLGLLATAVSVDVADINADGIDDINIKGLLGGLYSILSDGLGGFDAPSLSLGSLPTGNIYFNDFNNDGFPDLVVLDEVLGLVSVRLGLGDGTYGVGTSVNVGLLPSDLVMVDINGDGNQDAITINIGDNSANVLLGDGLGGLVDTVGQLLTDLLGVIGGLGPNLPISVVSADFNGDCRWDVAVWSGLTNEYIITLNQSGPDPSDLIFCSVFEDQSANF